MRDAFEQIIDLFELTAADGNADEPEVVWRLVSVSMQSPLTVVAEAVSAKPGANIDAAARAQKQNFARNYRALRAGSGVPTAWSRGTARDAARRVLDRSRRKVGKTQVILRERQAPNERDEEIEITQADAEASTVTLELAVSYAVPVPAIKPKEQIGSVEGIFVNVGTHYGKPAILIRERKTGDEIWCIISQEHEQEIASLANFEDVWRGHRLIVSGTISYDSSSKISRVTATGIRLVAGSEVELSKIQDKDFTGGMTSAEYLARLQEGQLGG